MFSKLKYKLVCTKDWGDYVVGQVVTTADAQIHFGGEWGWIVDAGCAEWQDNLPTLDEVQTEKWNEIKQAREVEQYKPLTFDGMVFDFDAKSQSAMGGAIQAAQASMILQQPLPPIEWTLADNSKALLSATQLMGILFAGIVRTGEVYVTARLLRDEIYKVDATVATVQAINW
jgi:hypothetical protein